MHPTPSEFNLNHCSSGKNGFHHQSGSYPPQDSDQACGHFLWDSYSWGSAYQHHQQDSCSLLCFAYDNLTHFPACYSQGKEWLCLVGFSHQVMDCASSLQVVVKICVVQDSLIFSLHVQCYAPLRVIWNGWSQNNNIINMEEAIQFNQQGIQVAITVSIL